MSRERMDARSDGLPFPQVCAKTFILLGVAGYD